MSYIVVAQSELLPHSDVVTIDVECTLKLALRAPIFRLAYYSSRFVFVEWSIWITFLVVDYMHVEGSSFEFSRYWAILCGD